MAELMLYQPYYYNLNDRKAYFQQVIQDYQINGVILHENMSCRPSCAGMYDLKQFLQNDLKIPTLPTKKQGGL